MSLHRGGKDQDVSLHSQSGSAVGLHGVSLKHRHHDAIMQNHIVGCVMSLMALFKSSGRIFGSLWRQR